MDGTRFDALARVFGAAVSRRSGAVAIIGTALGLASGGALAKGSRGDRRDAGQGPGAQGPCKTEKRPDNICTANSQCCTNICDKGTGATNKDKKGRCRCIRWRKPCEQDRNCCSRKNQKMACIEGICQKLIPTAQPCHAGDVCQDSRATCTTYTDGNPQGTFCLIAVTGLCEMDAQCVTERCVNRRCLYQTGESCGPVQNDNLCAGYQDGVICSTYDDGNPAGNYCVMPLLGPCNRDSDCQNERCINKVCQNPAQLTEPCGDSNAGAICVTKGATCTTYTYQDAPGGTYCLLPDNINRDVTTNCEANDQCRSGRCAMVDGKGQCAPLACSVCQPYDGVSACPYDSIQGYVDDNGSGGQIKVFAGQHLGQVSLTDADWHILPCCDDCFPEIGPADGDSYGIVLDVNNMPGKNVTVERMTLGGELPSSWWLQAWGMLDGSDLGYMNVLLDRVKTNLKPGISTYFNGAEETKLEIRDSAMKGFFIRSGTDQATGPHCYVTLTRSVLEGWGNAALQNTPAIVARTTIVSMVNSTIKNFRNTDSDNNAGGIRMRTPDSSYKSSLTMDASSRITGNVGASSYGNGIYAPNGEPITGATTTNVLENGGTSGLLQCATSSSAACSGF
ncbi:MAG: hypothetical protein ACKOWF_13410 [Chloroflexota bacterium]